MNKKYFSYLFQTKKTTILFIFLMYFALCASPFITGSSVVKNVSTFTDSMWYGFIMSVGLTFILPIILFSFIHQRRSRDVFLALPLKRKEILITSLVFAFTVIYGCMFLTFVILYMYQGRQWFEIVQFIEIIAYSAWIIISLLIIHTLLFLLANNVFDGIVMIASYTFMPLLIFFVESVFYSNIVAGMPTPGDSISVYFSPFLMQYRNYRALVDQSGYYDFSMIYVGITLVFTFIALFLLKKEFIERKSERSEQLSDRTFAYPFVINIYAFALLLCISFALFNSANELSYMVIYYLLIFIAYVIAEFVYHRSITFKISTVLKFLCAIGISAIIAFAGWKSEGFGQARNYSFPQEGTMNYSYEVICTKDFQETDASTEDSDKIIVSAYLGFPVEVKDQYADAITVFENNRKKSIDAFYSSNSDINADTCYFGIYSTMNNVAVNGTYYLDTQLWNYSYHSVPMSLDELKTIDQYTTVSVSDYNSSDNYSLDEYIEMEGLK